MLVKAHLMVLNVIYSFMKAEVCCFLMMKLKIKICQILYNIYNMKIFFKYWLDFKNLDLVNARKVFEIVKRRWWRQKLILTIFLLPPLLAIIN